MDDDSREFGGSGSTKSEANNGEEGGRKLDG